MISFASLIVAIITVTQKK
ncbi:hypothetical protein [Mesobacillus foraminis]|nr:hypothetical protein [Mesobacillus foraminis]